MLFIRNFISRATRFPSATGGASAVEFAILAFPFFLVVSAIFEIAFIFMAELVLDKGTSYAGRLVRVGQVQQQHMTRADFEKLTCDRVKVFLDCNKLIFDLRTYSSFDDVPTSIPISGDNIDVRGFDFQSARGGTIVALRVFYKWPLLTGMMRQFFANTGDGSLLLMSMSTFRTEPF